MLPCIRTCSRTCGRGISRARPAPGALCWLFDKQQRGWPSITPVLGAGSAASAEGREPFPSPSELEKQQKRVCFALIFFFKSFLAPSLPRLLPISLGGGGRVGSRERLAAFCFQFAQAGLCALCFFSPWKPAADRHFLQKAALARGEKASRKHLSSLALCTTPAWAVCVFPAMHQPPGTTSTMLPAQLCLYRPCLHHPCSLWCPAHPLPTLPHCSRGA